MAGVKGRSGRKRGQTKVSYAQIILLRVQKVPYREICEQLGVSERTVARAINGR